ncbi:hypothetical protein AURDEDRAFT_180492 [Auricularia subglabra TFB-10046 SS5]|nr:hypothetical protein AURDEDRAFT_180492 [Auricularia subglabra TFB-10046 SS5]
MQLLLSLTAFVGAALAFSDSYPLVAWSTDSSWSLQTTHSGMPSADSIADQLASTSGLCDHDRIFVVHSPGLHLSDLQLLPASSPLSAAIAGAPSSALVPHVVAPSSRLADLPANLERTCGLERRGGKHVIHFKTRPIQSHNGSARRAEVAAATSALARELAEHPSHLVVLVGTRAPNSAPKGGILARYQLLTPTIIVVGLVALGVLVPLLLFGASAIATIQSPLRSESFKPVSAQKKNQ